MPVPDDEVVRRTSSDPTESDYAIRKSDRDMAGESEREQKYRADGGPVGRFFLGDTRGQAADAHKRMQDAAEEGMAYRRGRQSADAYDAMYKARDARAKRASGKRR